MPQEKTDKYQTLIDSIKSYSLAEAEADKANEKLAEAKSKVHRLVTELGNKYDGFYFGGKLYTTNGHLNVQDNIVNLENPPEAKPDTDT